MTTEGGAGKVHITSPDTTDVNNSFCADPQTPFIPSSDKVHPTVTLDYATMVANGFNGVFYVDKSSAVEPASCLVKGGLSRSSTATTRGSFRPTSKEPETFRLSAPTTSTQKVTRRVFRPVDGVRLRGVNVQNTPENAYASLDALTADLMWNITPQITDGYYVNVAAKSVPYRYTGKNKGSWDPIELANTTNGRASPRCNAATATCTSKHPLRTGTPAATPTGRRRHRHHRRHLRELRKRPHVLRPLTRTVDLTECPMQRRITNSALCPIVGCMSAKLDSKKGGNQTESSPAWRIF